jgi:hypothetical protein
MNNTEFIKAWCTSKDKINKYESKELDLLNLSETTKSFLKTGLPSEASPFLTFGPLKTGLFSKKYLPTAKDIYNIDESFKKYIIIGSDGSGNPICLNIQNKEIYLLNHENKFYPRFLNTSLPQLAHFLLEIRISGEKLSTLTGYNEIIGKLKNIDKRAIENQSWWTEELKTLIDQSNV